jgi:hypothetical protein
MKRMISSGLAAPALARAYGTTSFRAASKSSMIRGFMLACTVLVAGSAVARESWPIKEFEVVPGVPWQDVRVWNDLVLKVDWLAPQLRALGFDTDRAFSADPPLTPELKRQMESYLKEAATVLEAYGFPAPALEPVVDTVDGRRAYRVYYVNLHSGRSRYESPFERLSWSPPDRVIFLHGPNIVSGASITDGGYSVLGHELFHAVQYATPFFRAQPQGAIGSWITEGQATAVGLDLARRLRNVQPTRNVFGDLESFWGKRNYADVLAVTRPREARHAPEIAYATQSFWRYLAELDDARRPGGPHPLPGPTPGAVDYRYLAHLLNRAPGARTMESELAWLDAGLNSYARFGFGLRGTFHDFISVYSDYGTHRLGRGADFDPATARMLWIAESFTTDNGVHSCSFVELDPNRRKATTTMRVERVAARCVEVELSGFGGQVGVEVQVETTSRQLLEQLAISLPGGQRVAVPIDIGTDPKTGKPRARWSLRLDDKSLNGANHLLLSNVAAQADRTRAQTIDMVLSVGGLEVDDQPATSGEPTRASPRPARKPGPAGAREEAEGRLQRATGRVVSNGPLGQTLGRAEDEPFMEIRLRPMPDALGVISEVNTAGGMAAQLLASGELMHGSNPLHSMQGLAEALLGAGEQISIRIPRIDYGFAGTIPDVKLQVGGSTGPTLEARGPIDSDPTPLVYFPPSGRVTIDEYTPDFMSGSFAGDLINVADQPTQSRKPVFIANVERRISGRFWISSPWLADERFERSPTANLDLDLQSDLIRRLPSELSSISPGAAAAAASGSGSDDDEGMQGVAVSLGCDCSCEGKKKAEAARAARTPGEGRLTAEQLSLASCMSLCIAQYLQCP